MIRIIWFLLIGLLFVAFGVLLVDKMVAYTAKDKLYEAEELEQLPKNKVGLVLGTTKILANGRLNRYYKYRIAAAVRLYEADKIAYLLVSGDNKNKEYDEPTDMYNDLIAAGVPSNRIYRDYAGFRTLDSVVRSKVIFGQEKITIISQNFHNERALFLARRNGIDAVAYNARDISLREGFKIRVRELLARSKMILDLLSFKQPKYLGESIQIG